MWGEEQVKTQVLLRRWLQHHFRYRLQRGLEFCFLNVLEHHALAALLLDYFVVIGQVVRRCLDAVVAVARGKNFIHHADGRRRSQLGYAVLRIFRQIVFDLLQVLAQKNASRADSLSSRTLMYASNAAL